MNRLVLIWLYFLFMIPSLLFAQQNGNVRKPASYDFEAPQIPISISPSPKDDTVTKKHKEKSRDEFNDAIKNQPPVVHQQKNKTEPSFDIVSSFKSNIRLGGFSGKYAVVNFTPQVNLKPASFISIYASHNTSCYVPIEGIREHMTMLCIQSAAVMVIDNTVNLLYGTEKMIPSIASFIAKTLIINTLMSSINKNKKNKVFDYKSYYYSVTIKF